MVYDTLNEIIIVFQMYLMLLIKYVLCDLTKHKQHLQQTELQLISCIPVVYT